MEGKKDCAALLDYTLQAAFRVTENTIDYANPAARSLMLEPGTDVRTLLATGEEEYAAFSHGCLYLKLKLAGGSRGASVTRMGQSDIFLLEPENAGSELQALALAAMELRLPLSNALVSAERLETAQDGGDFLQRLNRGLSQLHRILNNMSDVTGFAAATQQSMEDLSRVFGDIFERAQVLVSQAGRTLTYQGLTGPADSLADREQLERAVLSILSNALKFTPEGGTIAASLTRRGRLLQLSIQDNGSGIPEDLLPHIFTRYLRQPAQEDSRHGIGLGLVLVRTVALNHGGTVLIDKPGDTGTRITMTLELRKGTAPQLRSPITIPGGQDMGLIELSETLPYRLYRS